ncbi:MAG: nucleotide exchange factor GrpE [Nitrospirota bacterium]|nr:nucleotide exchange factor GrpE [Nitrospirota bacterium]
MSENNDSNSDEQSGESLSEPEIVSGPTGESGELQEIKEWKDKYLRLLADFDNNRKRVARDLDESRKFANESLLRSFLPVLDNLERALKHVETGDSGVSAECQSLVEGVRLTHKQFVELLEKNHVTKVLSEGVPFDPEVHEAVGYTESGTHPEGTIVDVYQQGYRIQNRLIRPAMVTVSKGSHS